MAKKHLEQLRAEAEEESVDDGDVPDNVSEGNEYKKSAKDKNKESEEYKKEQHIMNQDNTNEDN